MNENRADRSDVVRQCEAAAIRSKRDFKKIEMMESPQLSALKSARHTANC